MLSHFLRHCGADALALCRARPCRIGKDLLHFLAAGGTPNLPQRSVLTSFAKPKHWILDLEDQFAPSDAFAVGIRGCSNPRQSASTARFASETLSVTERQRIVRLLVKDVLVGEDTFTIRHSISIPSGPPQNSGSQSPDRQNYPLCTGSDQPAAQ
jgi:hypothetical protein